MMSSMPKDTATRYQAIYARHKQNCALERGADCDCKPSYWGKVYDRAARKHRKTQMVGSLMAARQARADLETALRGGTLVASSAVRVSAAIDAYLRAIESGRALNKHGRAYKPTAIRDIEGALQKHVAPALSRRRLTDVRRSDVQQLVNELSPRLSGSRIRTIVNAIHSLYAWAQDLELAQHDPASRVRLPAMNATPRDRVATPAEMVSLLSVLPVRDALPFALAAYATLRREEVRQLRVGAIDFAAGKIIVERSKSLAGERAVPIVRPLAAILRRTLLERGRPGASELLCRGLKPGGGNSGLLSFEALQTRADEAWDAVSLRRITAHECRHTAVTWLDAAGVRPVVVSMIAGHAVATGGAVVTARYTHVLPGELVEARKKLDAYLARETMEATG